MVPLDALPPNSSFCPSASCSPSDLVSWTTLVAGFLHLPRMIPSPHPNGQNCRMMSLNHRQEPKVDAMALLRSSRCRFCRALRCKLRHAGRALNSAIRDSRRTCMARPNKKQTVQNLQQITAVTASPVLSSRRRGRITVKKQCYLAHLRLLMRVTL